MWRPSGLNARLKKGPPSRRQLAGLLTHLRVPQSDRPLHAGRRDAVSVILCIEASRRDVAAVRAVRQVHRTDQPRVEGPWDKGERLLVAQPPAIRPFPAAPLRRAVVEQPIGGGNIVGEAFAIGEVDSIDVELLADPVELPSVDPGRDARPECQDENCNDCNGALYRRRCDRAGTSARLVLRHSPAAPGWAGRPQIAAGRRRARADS